jgi:hypothetical protein
MRREIKINIGKTAIAIIVKTLLVTDSANSEDYRIINPLCLPMFLFNPFYLEMSNNNYI